ncbi:hypothetical protein [Shinella oryzae]|uniref:hypothetical protein n=1 Tax=Shinella oryzae TaxID=2871820 RepID=UPI001FF643D0|nr:hypothetical protein [Shinella oryzae]UPA27551.1 hypothetical protein K6301_18570 [Shinella oryzae]
MGDDASIAFDSPVTPFEQKAKTSDAKGEFNGMAIPAYALSTPCILPLVEGAGMSANDQCGGGTGRRV